ncbi:MAG: enoyl-CoA hydratase-related protein [Vicinamibacterales bacterium]|nr:enoyl-CoA hydratase-related protein [Vicinamibacterales bacterium]
MTYTQISTTRTGAVERVTLNRPEVRNAFNEVLVAELTAWARTTAADASVRACVLAGAGPVFSAGADIAWMARMVDYSEEENRRDARAMAEMFDALDRLPQPLVGRVQGAALGGGAGLAATCDIVVAADTAVFGFTEVKLGILPAVISPYCVRKVGASQARALMLTGARFDAARALRAGLVHEVVAEGGLDEAVERHLHEILGAAPGAIAATKHLIAEVAGRRPADCLDLTSGRIAAQRVSPEGQEGLRAFLAKRAPGWAR